MVYSGVNSFEVRLDFNDIFFMFMIPSLKFHPCFFVRFWSQHRWVVQHRLLPHVKPTSKQQCRLTIGVSLFLSQT
jgi:hypothetical protein